MPEYEVVYYSYRTAMVGSDIQVPRRAMRVLEARLAAEVGVALDNHVVYGIVEQHKATYFFFTDFKCIIGGADQLLVRNW